MGVRAAPSPMETDALAIEVRSDLSEKSVMESCSVPSLRLSGLREWVKEKTDASKLPNPSEFYVKGELKRLLFLKFKDGSD